MINDEDIPSAPAGENRDLQGQLLTRISAVSENISLMSISKQAPHSCATFLSFMLFVLY